jgi:hypothetical protein
MPVFSEPLGEADAPGEPDASGEPEVTGGSEGSAEASVEAGALAAGLGELVGAGVFEGVPGFPEQAQNTSAVIASASGRSFFILRILPPKVNRGGFCFLRSRGRSE